MPVPSRTYIPEHLEGGREGRRALIRDVDERRNGGELPSSDRLQQKLESAARTCANVDMERTARGREKVSSARWGLPPEAL